MDNKSERSAGGGRSKSRPHDDSMMHKESSKPTPDFDKLLNEIASKCRRYDYDIRKIGKQIDTKNTGEITEKEFENLVLKDLHFKATTKEIDDLIKYYSRKAPKGIVHYKKFDDDIYYINKKKKEREKRDASRDTGHSRHDGTHGDTSNLTKTHSELAKEEAKKVDEEPISTKPSPNLPNDSRYSMRNTVIGRYPESRKAKHRKVAVADVVLQDIIKATYLRNSYIEDYFKKFGKGRSYVISQDKLKDAFDSLGISLDSKSMHKIYKQLLNDDKDLTAEMIDVSVEDSAKKSIEEIQKFLLELVNKSLKEIKDLDKKKVFEKYDTNNKGFVSFKQFDDSIKEYVSKIQSMDAYFLAKRY